MSPQPNCCSTPMGGIYGTLDLWENKSFLYIFIFQGIPLCVLWSENMSRRCQPPLAFWERSMATAFMLSARWLFLDNIRTLFPSLPAASCLKISEFKMLHWCLAWKEFQFGVCRLCRWGECRRTKSVLHSLSLINAFWDWAARATEKWGRRKKWNIVKILRAWG